MQKPAEGQHTRACIRVSSVHCSHLALQKPSTLHRLLEAGSAASVARMATCLVAHSGKVWACPARNASRTFGLPCGMGTCFARLHIVWAQRAHTWAPASSLAPATEGREQRQLFDVQDRNTPAAVDLKVDPRQTPLTATAATVRARCIG